MTNNQKLIDVYSRILEIAPEAVKDELIYNSIPEWDSTAHMLLVAELEGCFDVMLDMDDIIDMSSVAKCKEILAKYEVTFEG
ncbi:acyl carrier protein [Aliagarivorans marinus]|uniref:acyl carrier protein n=1 Tax=Aliagarivorans marinus TaxID=561965 RepID=UPI00041E0C15|nr:acyl carrier protein [Aliagarivorans marinus]